MKKAVALVRTRRSEILNFHHRGEIRIPKHEILSPGLSLCRRQIQKHSGPLLAGVCRGAVRLRRMRVSPRIGGDTGVDKSFLDIITIRGVHEWGSAEGITPLLGVWGYPPTSHSPKIGGNRGLMGLERMLQAT